MPSRARGFRSVIHSEWIDRDGGCQLTVSMNSLVMNHLLDECLS